MVRACMAVAGVALLCSAHVHAAGPVADAPAASQAPAATAGLEQSLRLLLPKRWAEENALHAAVALYPQLLQQEGALDGATVALAFHPDGRVAASEIRAASPPPPGAPVLVRAAASPAQATQRWVQALLPSEAERHSVAMRSRGTTVAGARLTTDVTVYFTRVPANFDAVHSAARVRQIVGPYHRDLLFTGDDTRHRLTVLLNEDGSLLNRHVDRIDRASITVPFESKPAGAWARELAARLRIDVAQIGLMGTTAVQDGAELYLVEYAWRRRPGETGPQVLEPLPPRTMLDTGTARSLLERHFPDAIDNDDSAGTPAFVLSLDGEVLRTGRVPVKNGGLTSASLNDPLLAGLRIEDLVLHSVDAPAGRARKALFVWQSPDPAPSPGAQIEQLLQGGRR